ncbi:nucleoside/nucleotide kinase family protein [Nocardioides baculatus]|uniref:Nucleoside/nucleotide kinase family protein n=1 Tax=Nocardioides baculatus TaxID=2801337 RepID=A0ABS1LCJ0_9ACTN|nr:nucleoside/nucleotide kinase family protein [Nocardioides baculatus]MBL0749262.1 nucleoside/nucleotide kinase family protein [Nocardioides baculatus]
MRAQRASKPPLDELVSRALGLVPTHGRAILGITGPPGAGKSTLTSALLAELGLEVAHLPMDGFHLADVQLDRLGLRERKGAPETFDVDGYVTALRRLHDEPRRTLYVPGFERDLEQPIAAELAIPPSARLVITEGNYLLLDDNGWEHVRPLLAECWYVDLDDAVRRSRLVARHQQFGKTPDAAREWVDQVDEANSRLVGATRSAADLLVTS